MHHNGEDLVIQDMDLPPGEVMATTLHLAPVQLRVAAVEAIRTMGRQDSVMVCQDMDMEAMETIKEATNSSTINLLTIATTMAMDSDRDLDIRLAMANR